MHGLIDSIFVVLVTALSTTFGQWPGFNNYPQTFNQYPQPSPHQNIYPPSPRPPQYPQQQNQYVPPPTPQQYAPPAPPQYPPAPPPPAIPKQKPPGQRKPKPKPVAPAHPAPMTRAPPPQAAGPGAYGTGPAAAPNMMPGMNPFGGGFGGPMPGPPGGKNFCKLQCAHKVYHIEPRCGYNGETYRNECELQCETYEACDSTCPCFKGISSPPDHMRFILKPDPRVFPTMAQASGKKTPGGRRKGRKRGRKGKPARIPNCICTDPTPEMVCSVDGKKIKSACEAFCTRQMIRCDKPCFRCPPFGMGFGAAPGATPRG